jgi:hypothetical protein
VLVYEGRPSFATTFVRRALEGDARFQAVSVSGISRGLSVRAAADSAAPPERFQANALDRFDCIVVGGLDGLTAADVDALDRFARVRGGSVALVPDRLPSSRNVEALLPPGRLREMLLETQAALTMSAGLPRLDASELLMIDDRVAGDEVLAASTAPVIVVSPHGDGRVLLSGALDAWRFRGGDFDRFWRSTIAGLALAAPPPIDVRVSPALVVAGERVRIVATIRRNTFDQAAGDASAVAASVDGREPVRLWPDAARGVFSGTFAAPDGRGVHRVEVVTGATPAAAGSAPFVVRTEVARALDTNGPPLSVLAAAHGGVDASPDRLSRLEDHLRASMVSPTTKVRVRPMRSAWWMAPFVGFLTIGWWFARKREV